MKALISRWGSELAVRLPDAAVDGLRLREGEAVELRIMDDCIEIRANRPRYRLEELVEQISAGSQPEAIHFPQRGQEAL
jgi:antitoxin component of MazEF toxin-antitoxin module